MTTKTQLYNLRNPIEIIQSLNGLVHFRTPSGVLHIEPIDIFERDYEPVTVDGWRDISEAPLDRGTVLLTGFIYINGTRTTERWVCAAKFADNNWFALEEIATDTWEELFNPTHFMPLPPAPKVPSGEDSGKKGFDYETRKKDWHKAPSGEE